MSCDSRNNRERDDGYVSDATLSVQSTFTDDSVLPDIRHRSSSRLTDFINDHTDSDAVLKPPSPSRRASFDSDVKPSRRVKLVKDSAFSSAKTSATKTKAHTVADIQSLFVNQKLLSEEEALSVVKRAEDKLKKEPNLLMLQAPAIIIGLFLHAYARTLSHLSQLTIFNFAQEIFTANTLTCKL